MKIRITNHLISRLLAVIGAMSLVCSARAQSAFTTLHSFTALQSSNSSNDDGKDPLGDIIVMSGTLYGTTSRGGAMSDGVLFRMNLDGTGFTNLHSFGSITDGGGPVSGVVCSGNVLYGTLQFGGSLKGAVFAVNSDGTGFRYLHTFQPGDFNSRGFLINADGAGPQGGLVLSGNVLYGTTVTGGTSGAGALFAVNIDGTGFRNLHFFDALGNSGPATNRDGGRLGAGLVLSGNVLYGTAEIGGEAGAGTIFSIHTDGTGFQKLYTFTNGDDGGMPFSALTLSGTTLYGTTAFGGSGFGGTIFAIGTDGKGFRVLHSFPELPPYPGPFTNSDGATPNAKLLLSENTLYGTASAGGAFGSGTLFSIDVDGTGFRTLYSFSALPPYTGGPPPTNGDGVQPRGGLAVFNRDLFGTASQGGDAASGTVFRFSLPGRHQPDALTIAVSCANVLLTWPTNNAGAVLQACTNLTNPVWVTVSATNTAINGVFQWSEPAQTVAGAARFYRLSVQ